MIQAQPQVCLMPAGDVETLSRAAFLAGLALGAISPDELRAASEQAANGLDAAGWELLRRIDQTARAILEENAQEAPGSTI